MTEQRELYIGLISGTSVDCIDAVLVDFSTPQPHFLQTLGHAIPGELKSRLYQLMTPGDGEIDRMGIMDQQLGQLFADAVLQLLDKAGVSPAAVKAVGSHGQTIRHRPPGELEAAFTLQIGDPNLIAERSRITTVADFRRRDMAAGGQGAPLVPAFHRAVFHSPRVDRIILNIGGIANLTILPRDGEVLGFDTGPGNGLMDGWIRLHKQLDFDADGRWAGEGTVHAGLLQTLLMHPYFGRPAPKSTGKEMFTLNWLKSAVDQFPGVEPEDVQATLLELTAATISNHIDASSMAGNAEIFVCGGGAYNGRLMARLRELLPPHRIGTTEELGIPPDWVEAGAFAWLAKQTLARRPGNMPSVTGATREVVLGSVYYA
jgi:anhydro-N-acetylmuramic acid kinase